MGRTVSIAVEELTRLVQALPSRKVVQRYAVLDSRSCMHLRSMPLRLSASRFNTLYGARHELQGSGTMWKFSVGRGLVESAVPASPGMLVSLFLIVPGAQPLVTIDEARVTWARDGEFRLQFERMHVSDYHRLQQLLMAHAH